ncbi:MAG TPA: hypothetical protein VGB54_03975 [Allosphingosinicella sp.]|jgi:hypothetical protein
MPQYRFILSNTEASAERAEEFGIFNDEGAMRFARRYGGNRAVEVWEQERLVGRIESNRTLIEAD